MSGKKAIQAAVDKLFECTIKSKGRIETLVSGATTPGSRAVPARNSKDDTAIGARVDNGEVYKKDGRMVKAVFLQPNKNAENRTLRTMAEKNSHQNLAFAEVPIEPEADDQKKRELAKQIFADFKKSLD
ncbi:hypothetical protein G7Y89_g8731 [Cudoniella acicularis]|uniref:Uncharacterized protein n=1 Tax=Cudoniella acicularis TaxID=354080 RepID=A0A8H4W2L4_9HELO|nr:hypothetical protein G7Y89_g8731 [Cudoniella acicularis]